MDDLHFEIAGQYDSTEEVRIPLDSIELEGNLSLPPNPVGVVIFSHGSGSSRFSPRNRYVAAQLQEGRFGTLLLDLLTPGEDRNYATRFDIQLLTARLTRAVLWVGNHNLLQNFPICLFGSSTGAASALRVAALLNDQISAVVSRGGRPDLAGQSLERVTCPCLFIVGGNDQPVISLNQDALALLGSKEKRLKIVPGATHLFEEPGALKEVAAISSDWFKEHVPNSRVT